MSVDYENRLDLAGLTSQEKTPSEPRQEWQAYPKGKIQIPDGNGGKITFDLGEWYNKLGIPNRAGT